MINESVIFLEELVRPLHIYYINSIFLQKMTSKYCYHVKVSAESDLDF